MQQFGQILFILGIIFAVLAGIGFEHPWLPVGLAIFGVFVGIVNMRDVDPNSFLITGIALEVSASAFRQFTFIGAAMSDVMIFVGGALLVVAMRTLFQSALSRLWKTHQ
ncbi:MAG: hypothetical protein HKP21_02560 [Xanthomonadales bacterium]|nr:hypothetical protein [Gammaproteobacteria bacterium]NNK03408.1 hypothetical protein [Xanthomonadales bacterium]